MDVVILVIFIVVTGEGEDFVEIFRLLSYPYYRRVRRTDRQTLLKSSPAPNNNELRWR